MSAGQTRDAAAGGWPGRALPWARSARLALREFAADDRDAVMGLHSDARMRTHLVDDHPLHEPGVAALFLRQLTQFYRRCEGLGIWHATALQPQTEFVGWFSLMPLAAQPGDVELGSRLLPTAWGRGMALEGCELLLDHAFDDLNLPQVWSVCHPDNRSALAVLAALGFETVGLRPYEGAPAQHLRVDLNAWRELRNTPRGTRMRRALRARPSSRVMPAVATQGTCP